MGIASTGMAAGHQADPDSDTIAALIARVADLEARLAKQDAASVVEAKEVTGSRTVDVDAKVTLALGASEGRCVAGLTRAPPACLACGSDRPHHPGAEAPKGEWGLPS